MNQWKPLLPSVDSPQSHGGGSFGFPGRQTHPQAARPITKNPQSMFQTLPNNPTSGSLMRGSGGGGSPSSSFGGGNRFNSLTSNGFETSHGFGGSSNGLNGMGSAFNRLEPRTSPNYSNGYSSTFGNNSSQSSTYGNNSQSSAFGNNGSPSSAFGHNGSPNSTFGHNGSQSSAFGHNSSQSSTFGNNSQSSTNGFADLLGPTARSSGSGFGGGGASNGFESSFGDRFERSSGKPFEQPPNRSHHLSSFDRSMSSGGGFDGFRGSSNNHAMNSSSTQAGNSSTNGFDRQLSAPNSMREMMNGNGMMNGGSSNGRMMNMMTSNGSGGNHGSGSGSNDFGGGRSSFGRQSPLGMFGGGVGTPAGIGASGAGRGGGGGTLDDGSMMKIGTWNDVPSNSSQPGAMGTNFPQVSNFEIGTFNAGSSSGNGFSSGGGNNSFSQSGTNITGGPGIRETGIIEKLLHSYGFIQCCDRQARLFFHFSQFDGNIEHLKIGDPVEFEMTYDRRTGKPIASLVSKIAPDVVMREERVIGTVTTEPGLDPETGQDCHGRISYENRGECFFLPFTKADVEGNVTVTSKDKVSFQMATMARSGNLVARTIRLEDPASPVKYQGVVNTLSDDHGLIERADVVREIIFHLQDMKDSARPVQLGDDVEFIIQTRSGKEVASAIEILPTGTVVFEDVGAEFFKGQVLKPCDRSGAHGFAPGGGHNEEALSGRVKYRGLDRSEEEIQFAEKDQVGDFSLRHGDWVRFVIAVDRRDKLKRATKIELLEESFNVSDERREQGMIEGLKEKDKMGVIRCADRDAKIMFRFSELLDVQLSISVGDEVAFTVAEGDQITRIRHLDTGTVQFHVTLHSDAQGVVTAVVGSPSGGSTDPAGRILYELNGMNLEIPYYPSEVNARQIPQKGDIVQFNISRLKATKETMATNLRILESNAAPSPTKVEPKRVVAAPPSPPEHVELCNGYIAALKDGFGFLENASHEKEVFFHFSNVDGKAEKLEVGMEVAYMVYNREKGGKLSAESVRMVEKGTLPALVSEEAILQGQVVRPLRSVNPDQDEYCGEIHVYSDDGKTIQRFQFSIASLANKKDLLQVNDPVQLQPCVDQPHFASNVKSTREKRRAFVEAMKGSFGFLSYEVEGGKKLFFHTCEVEDNEVLQQGDEVEFVVVSNKRTNKHSAVAVRKISTCKRPDRLISKLKTLNLDGGMKVVVIRQPKGPESGAGFKAPRNITHP
eukprot:maker-scaffold1022_size69981-snap-gene-0.9 protein:Tk07082 transcript:maker-scaffold1022_size69981-snap-gene-0.9-mRNA-1 annotation:"cold shock domain-containing protein e1"